MPEFSEIVSWHIETVFDYLSQRNQPHSFTSDIIASNWGIFQAIHNTSNIKS